MVTLAKQHFYRVIGVSSLWGSLYVLFPHCFVNDYSSSLEFAIILAVYTFITWCLVLPNQHKLFYYLAIPLYTQFLHLFQQYNYPLGANSLWRIYPFLIIGCCLIYDCLRRPIQLSLKERVLFALWTLLHIGAILYSPNRDGIYAGAFLFYLFIIPLFYAFTTAPSHQKTLLPTYATFLFLVFCFGTYGLIYTGVHYKNATNLLVTRNLADTNITIGYFILLWPLVLRYCSSHHVSPLPFLLIGTGLLLLSFSRGSLFLVVPYLLTSTLWKPLHWTSSETIISILLVGLASPWLIQIIESVGFSYAWELRIHQLQWDNSLWTQLMTESGRATIQSHALNLFEQHPFWGNGIASFEVLSTGFREAHSLFFTSLAEQGLLGTFFFYSLLFALGWHWYKNRHFDFLVSFLIYFVYNHTVGSVWVIMSAKSMTINCFAPLLLISMYAISLAVNHEESTTYR